MAFKFVDPETGFTSSVIKDPRRFVGRSELIVSAMQAVNANNSLVAVYGKRGVGKSSLLRQIQQIAIGNYKLVYNAGLGHLVPDKPRKFYTVYYSCDSMISNARDLIVRMCNDSDPEDGLLRLVPDQGKVLDEFSRTDEEATGLDLKLINWGQKGAESEKYSSAVPADPIQTFRNFVSGVVESNNRWWKRRDGVLILLDEFDVIKDKAGIGSLIKSLTSDKVKFAICGIGQDISALVQDHKSVARLIEQGSIHVRTMPEDEIVGIFRTAENLFDGVVRFDDAVVSAVYRFSEGYPYFAQLIGKACVSKANLRGTNSVDMDLFGQVLEDIRKGVSFPNLEDQYQLAVGESGDRALLLTLLAEQEGETTQYNQDIGRVVLKNSRSTAQELGIEHVDQLLPRLIEDRYGPVLVRSSNQRGVYEFHDPVFRAYVKLRR